MSKTLKELKQKFVQSPVLAFPRFDAPFHLYTDASDYGIRTVLSQKQDGAERAIAYASHQPPRQRERLNHRKRGIITMVWAVKQLRHYLLGDKFALISGHQHLKRLKTIKDPLQKLQSG